MDFIKQYKFEVVGLVAGLIILIIGLVSGTELVLFKMDGFYFFMIGILLIIASAGSIISKRKEEKKANS
ncbi:MULTISPECIES: hypothetical protein [Vagococcus]|uniref:Uncharacterized protein n=1 Tax=Vagococcus fluvialis bH819 TaxID=1255619 RepID=A0A1X6WN41_9ENTE|nr:MULTISPECIES: hypothetical protein [Vagococcus]SLM85679.1 hypothetical protein FM121_06225 [Vagococcus fluvialis bH819]HCM89646.1 hypothetical protein [Vagococcus sp.]